MRKILTLVTLLITAITLVGCTGQGGTSITAPTFVGISIDSTNPHNGSDFVTFYKERTESILVEVTLNNPDNLEIRSVVIDGYYYRSTRFTSDSTTSVVKFEIEAGDDLGEHVYSVDDIEYFDGTDVKTTLINSNNEFMVYVFKNAPQVVRDNYNITQNSISLDLNITDEDGVIVSDSLVVELFSGATRLDVISLTAGEHTVLFDGLDSDKHYEVKVKADFDVGDSSGLNEEVVLLSNSFTTLPNALPNGTITNVEVTSNSIIFDIDIIDNNSVIVPSGLKVVLINEGEPNIEFLITGDIIGYEITDLLNATDYTVQLVADYDLRDGLLTQETYVLAGHDFSTNDREVPLPTLDNLLVEQNRIMFDIVIEDPDGIILEETLVANLYIDGVLESSNEMNGYNAELQIFNVLAGFDFTIEIEATYNLNDGNGDVPNQVIFTEVLSTSDNTIPVMNVTNVSVTQGYVTVDLTVIDSFNTLKGQSMAILYEDGVEVYSREFGVGELAVIIEHPLSFLKDYNIEIISSYNLRDGNGTFNDVILYQLLLPSFEPLPPAAEIKNLDPNKEGFMFDVKVLDADETIIDGSVYVLIEQIPVYADDDLGQENPLIPLMEPIIVAMNDIGTLDFDISGILSNTNFIVSVLADYDVMDGSGVQEDQVLFQSNIMTNPKDLPTTIISNSDVTVDSITTDITIIDDDGVIEDGTLFAQLYKGVTPVGLPYPLTVGLNPGILFDTDILSSNSYDIKVFTDYDLNNGLGINPDLELGNYTVHTDTKTEPSAVISNIVSTEETISMEIVLTDEHDVISGNATAVLYIGDDPFLVGGLPYEIVLSEGLNANVLFTNIYSNQNYNIRVLSDYDLNNGNAIVEGSLLSYDFVTTYENILTSGDITSVIVGIDTITFTTIVNDEDGVIMPGTLEAVLYEGGTETDRVAITVGETTKSFTGLISDSEYTIQLVTNYNLRDIDQIQTNYLLDSYTTSTNAYTAPTGYITSLTKTINSVEFDVTIVDSDDTSTGDYVIELWYEGAMEDSFIVTEGITQNVGFTGLFSGVDYEIRVIATYDLFDVDEEQTTLIYSKLETTIAKKLPVGTASYITFDGESVRFIFDYIDEDETLIGGTMVAELYVPGIGLINSNPIIGEEVVFDITGFIANFDFTIQVSCDFNLSDGNNDVTGVCLDLDLTTPANTFPTAIISDISMNQDNVEVRINVQDEDNVIAQDLRAVIYDKDGLVVASEVINVGITDVVFDGITLDHNTLYNIVVQADINMRDASLLQQDIPIRGTQIMVFNKLIPQATVFNQVITDNTIDFDVTILDSDNTYVGNAIAKLYDGETMVDSFILGLGTTSVQFTGLISDHNYTVTFVIDYDNGDGNGTNIGYEMLSEDFVVLPKDIPTSSISNEVVTPSSIQFDVEVTDDDSIIDGQIFAILYEDDVQIDQVEIFVGSNTETFTNLKSNTVYDIKVIVDYNLFDLSPIIEDAVLVSKTNSTSVNTTPGAVITNVSVDSSTYNFDVDVTDADSVITALSLQAVLYKDSAPVATLPLNVGSNVGVSFTGLDSNSTYTVNIQADYDLNDGTAPRTDYVMVNDSKVTLINQEPSAAITSIVADYNTLTFNITVYDTDSVITGGTLFAELYLDGVPVGQTVALTAGINVAKEFDLILSNKNYEVKVITDYNLDDGTGEVVNFEMVNRSEATQAKQSPNATVTNTVVTNTSIDFDVDVSDPSVTITNNLQAILYKDEVAVGAPIALSTGANSVSFTSLEFGADYTVEIVTDYNNNTGVADVTGLQMTNFAASTRPLIVIESITNLPLEVNLDITIDDFFSVLYDGYLEITVYDKDSLEVADSFSVNVDTPTNAATIDLINFYNNHDYNLEFTAKVKDGGGSFTVETIHSMDITTERKQLQSIALQAITVTGTDIITGVSLVLPDTEFGLIDSGNSVYARLYEWDIITEAYVYQAEQVLLDGDNTITFNGYDGTDGTQYLVTIEATLDWNEADQASIEQIIEQRTFVYTEQN